MAESADIDRLRLLYDLGCAFTARMELNELLPLIIEKSREALSAEGVAVLLLDKSRQEFYFPYVADTDSEVARRLSGHRFPANLGFAGIAMSSGHSLRIDDVQNDPRHYHGTDRATGLGTRNLIAAPLHTPQSPIGVVEVVNCRGAATFTDSDLRFLEALSGSIAIALDNARLYAEARQAEARLRTQVGVLRRDLARQSRSDEMVGSGPAMAEVFQLMETAAASSITVLIEGETGTGKELVARGIHRAGARADNPFLAINCAAMPETLLESELFGHRRGAFTGAVRDNPGLFRAAAGGTVFLDEIADMPPAMQAKLLRVLEQGEVIPLGESMPSKIDVRVLSATNRGLSGEVRLGRFREDLYYRVSVFPISLPPLRARREDIPLLAHRFIESAAERQRKHISGCEESALEVLAAYDSPGNIRELQNEIERAVALAPEGAPLELERFSRSIRAVVHIGSPESASCVTGSGSSPVNGPRIATVADESIAAPPASQNNFGQPVTSDGRQSSVAVPELSAASFRDARAAFEARFIEDVLMRCDGNISRAAKLMGLSRVQLQRKIKEFRLR